MDDTRGCVRDADEFLDPVRFRWEGAGLVNLAVRLHRDCEHETTLFTPAFVDPVSSHMPVLYTCTSHSLQPALICAPTTDHDLDSCRLAQVRRR